MSKVTASTLLSVVLVACSAQPTTSKDELDDHDDDSKGEIGVFPTEVFTGFDGEHDFVVPVASIGGEATWTADDDFVTLKPSSDGVKITTKKAGKTTVTAKIGKKSFTVSVNITSYPKGAWATGENVYTQSVRCNACHVKDGAPDHSPSEIGKHEDAHIKQRIMTGESLHGEAVQPNHKFESALKDGELDGVVAYLRALTPRGWPKEEHEH